VEEFQLVEDSNRTARDIDFLDCHEIPGFPPVGVLDVPAVVVFVIVEVLWTKLLVWMYLIRLQQKHTSLVYG
jgi:hypothetical protein